MVLDESLKRIDQLLKGLTVQASDQVNHAVELLDGLSQQMEYLVVDKLDLVKHSISDSVESHITNANNSLDMVTDVLTRIIQRVNRALNDPSRGVLSHSKDFVHSTISHSEEILDLTVAMIESEIMIILDDLNDYFSPQSLMQMSSHNMLLDRMQALFAPTPEQVLEYQKKYQDLKLGQYRLDWDKIGKPKEEEEPK